MRSEKKREEKEEVPLILGTGRMIEMITIDDN